MRVAVLGAGYAGVTAARHLEGRLPDDVELVVVDEAGEHVVQHEIHRVVRRPAVAEGIRIPLSELLEDATVRTARVTDVDAEAGVAHLGDERLDYDAGVLCLGATTAFYDLPGLEANATPLKRIEHAREIRAEFLDVVEEGPGRVVVGGAGLSGVQVAGELAALADELDADPEVVVLEMTDSVAPGFPENFRTAVREELEDRGVEVRTGWRVREVTDGAVVTDRGDVEYDQLVWTGGIRGPDALGGDRPTVNHTLRVAGPTFGAGDAVAVVDREGQAVPDSSQTATRQGPVAAENAARLVEYEREGDLFEPRMKAYSYDERGWIVSIGNGAVAQVGPTVWRGKPAKALKTSVGAGYLSSIGAVRNAVDLVNEELGIADDVETEAPADG